MCIGGMACTAQSPTRRRMVCYHRGARIALAPIEGDNGLTVLSIALGHNIHDLLRTHALPLIAFVVFFEELGFPSPLPGELMMLLAGVQAAQGAYPLWLVLLVQEVAALLGGSGLYFVCRRIGRPLVLRYGRYVHLRAETLDRAENLIRRRGFGAVAVGRIIPGICIVVPVAAGVLGMSYPLFLAAFALGVLGYVGALTLTGYVVGPHALTLFERVTLPIGALVSIRRPHRPAGGGAPARSAAPRPRRRPPRPDGSRVARGRLRRVGGDTGGEWRRG